MPAVQPESRSFDSSQEAAVAVVARPQISEDNRPDPRNASQPNPIPTESGGGGSSGSNSSQQTTFAQALSNAEIHPVILVGTGKTSKTSLLMSLCGYPTMTDDAIVSLRPGGDIFPDTFPEAALRNNSGKRFFNNALKLIAEGKPWGISIGIPFYASILARFKEAPQEVGSEQAFAFLEMMGERYEEFATTAQSDNNSPEVLGEVFRDVPDIVRALFQQYQGPLSIIFCAPSSTARNDDEFKNSHRAIINMVNEYTRLRGDLQKKDHALYLLTYWDRVPVRQQINPLLPRAVDFEQQLKNPGCRDSWHSVKALKGRVGSLAAMPYTPFIFNGTGDDARIITIRSPQQDAYTRFNECIWNWLYGNVSSHSGDSLRPYLRNRLAPPPKRLGILNRILSGLLLLGNRR